MATRAHATHATHKRTHHNGSGKKNVRNQAENLFQHTFDEFKEKSDDVRNVVHNYVQENPFKAVGYSLLAGALLALLIRR